ncbi:MAG: NAD-dependent epimerase/dehydratase family protein [Halobacteriovoraceae bacterium]|nr:NAD-dependent epimerase/dehydratase family protein [Halobacteriovoraceae bacterium]
MEKVPRSLVTGAAGFLGSHLVDQLMKEGHEVIGIDNEVNGTWENLKQWLNNPRFKKVHQDINEIYPDDESFQNLDYVFHLAGIECPVTSIKNPEVFFHTNVMGTVKVCQAARQSHDLKNFLYASSSAIYGDPSTPTLEDDPIAPLTPSCLSKAQGEDTVLHWGEMYGFPTTSLRVFNSFGPRSQTKLYPGSVFNIWFKQTHDKKPLTVVGDGSHARDFISCTDVANAFYVAAKEAKDGEVYNVGSGQATELNLILNKLGNQRIQLKSQKDQPSKTWANITKFEFDCHWQPRIPLETGIEFCKDVLEDWKNSPEWDEDRLNNFFETWFEVYS